MTEVSALHRARKYLASADEALRSSMRQSRPSQPRALFRNMIIAVLRNSEM